MSIQPSFKEIIGSNDPKVVEDFLNNKQSRLAVSEVLEELQCFLKEKKDSAILKLIFERLKSDIKDKAINGISKDGTPILFLALNAGKDYFEVFQNYENISWSVLNENGSNLLHYALSLKGVSEESEEPLDFLYEKLGGLECLFAINDDSENALHCAARSGSLKNFKWCLDKCKDSNYNKVESLLHNVNKIGETPAVELLKNKNSLSDEASFKEIINVLKENKYDFLKADRNEQNAISLAVQNNYKVLLDPFLSNDSYKEEIAFSAIEDGKDDLLQDSIKNNKGDFIVQNYDKLIKKYPKRLANFVANDQSILSDYIKLYGTKDCHFTNEELFDLFSEMMYLAIDYTDYKLADQCLEKYKLSKNYVSYYQKNLTVPDLLNRLSDAGITPLDYAYKNNPEMFAKLVQRLPELELDILLNKSSVNQESHQVIQKEEIASGIAGLFTSVGSCGWYDTGGILASLADLVVEQSNNDAPKIFVQDNTYDQRQPLSYELKEVSKLGKNIIYIRRKPTNEKGESSPHWVVFYFSQGENGKRNLLAVDPYGANEPSAVIKEAVKGIVNNIYVSTTKIQYDGNSCGLISSEVARAIYSQKEEIRELLRDNDQIDIKQILPDGLMSDAKENGKVDYGQGFENFKCAKIRSAHVQTARAIDGITFDTVPSQASLQRICIGKESALAKQTANLGGNSIEQIYDLCQGDEEKTKNVTSILENGGKVGNEVIRINRQQIEELRQILGEGFKDIKKRLNDQMSELSDKQRKKIEQIREGFELNLTNTAQQKYKIDNSLLYKFLCSASVNDVKEFLGSNGSVKDSEDLSKAAFAAARDGNLSRLEVFINCDNDLIYETDDSGKSLLEAAAENFHPEVVQYIVRKHNEIYKNQNDRTPDEVSSNFLSFVNNIDNRKDSWAKDLARELKKTLKKEDFNESDGLKIDAIFNPYIDNKKQEKNTKNVNDYGCLQRYADVLRADNPKRFKDILEEGLRSNSKLFSLLSHDNYGHNLITLTAALGTPDHWKEIEKVYSKIEERTAISASLDDTSLVGSSIQAAIIANNLPMYNHFLDSKDGFVVDKQYGEEKNNILHTVLQSNRVELLNNIFLKFKDNKKPLIKALLQTNKDNKSPLDLALEKGHYGFFEKALDVIANHDKETIRDLLIANDCKLIKSAVSLGNERVVERIFSLQDECNKGVKDEKNRLNLLGYKNIYDKKGRLEKSELLDLACKYNNADTANSIFKLLKEEKKLSNKVLVNALTASISKDSDNREIFSFLFGQGVDFSSFSQETTGQRSPMRKAAECGNTRALNYFIDKFPKSNVLNLQDKDGKTPLHLAISNGNRKTGEFLIENGADFDKSDNEGITPFELALQDNRFADVCINLLKFNPKATAPLHRAILSGNENLIAKLIDQEYWVLDQHNEETTLKFALRNEINKNLTAEIANKSIENFKKLDKKSKEDLLKLGFLNDIVKSGIYDLYEEGSKEAGEINDFIKSEIKKDRSLLSVTSQGTTLLYDIVISNRDDLFTNIENDIGHDAITKIGSDQLGETALHAAVKNNNVFIVKTLLEKIGDQKNIKLAVNEYNAEGCTPFQMAAQLGNEEIYNLLKERGGDLKSKTKAGNSIAHLLILSAMKNPLDDGYEYQKLFKDQLTEKDAVNLLSKAILSNNFDVVQEIVFDNMKGKVSLVNKIVSAIAGDNTVKTPNAKIRKAIANTITSKPQEHVDNINKTKVLSQSIKKVLSSTEEKKQSLLQNTLNFLHIKAQKGSSDKVDIDALFNFLIEDQNSYEKSIDNFPLVEEEVKVSRVRKDIFIQQGKLNEKLDCLKQKQEYQSWKKKREACETNRNILETCEIIIVSISTNDPVSNIAETAYEYYMKHCFQEDNPHKNFVIEEAIKANIYSVVSSNPYIDFKSYIQKLKKLQSKEDKIKVEDNAYDNLGSELNKCDEQIKKLNKKIENYQANAHNLFKTKVSQDVLYTNCRNLEGKSIADHIFTSNELPLIKKIILEDQNLWDPRFIDSEGNTLLHKLAQMVEKDNTLINYIEPLIDRGFSLTRKNNDGRSVKDIFEDMSSKIGNNIGDYLAKTTQTEEQVHKLFEGKLNSLLESSSADNLAKAIHDDEKGCKKYYGTIFNPFHSVVSSCFNRDLSNDYLFKKKLNCFEELFKSDDLKSALDKTDEERYNFLHRAVEKAIGHYSGSHANKMLEHILLDVARGLNGSRNFKLCNELFFKQRNSNGDNVIEALSKVQNSSDIFKKLEKEFGKNAFTDECDLNLILVNAAGSKNSSLFEHVIEKYRLNRFRTPSEEGQPPFHAAVMSGDQEVVLTVLKSGANINQINSNGRTALHELLIFLRDNPDSQKHIGLVYYLVSRGAFFGDYQEEEKGKEGEISEIIESIDGDYREKILFNIARGRSDFYDLKYRLLSEAENFIKLKDKSSPLMLDLDIGGGTVFVQINNGTFKSSQFLNGDICKSNHLTTSYFNIDGCQGYVQRSAGGKRNYVISEDAISEENDKKHPTKIKVWLSQEQSITVLVSADGTIEPFKASYKVLGVEVEDDLLGYQVAREKFEKGSSEYKDCIEKLWNKVDSQGEYKNEVYIGGIPLKEALMQGRWRAQNMQGQQQTQSKEQERIQKSPENNTPSHSRRNSRDDEVGETIEDAQLGGKVNGKYLESRISSKVNSQVSNSQEVKDTQSQQVKILDSEKKKNFYEGIGQAAKEIAEGLKDVVEKSYYSLNKKTRFISNSQEVKSAQSQQVKILNDEKGKNFYEDVKEVIKEMTEGLKDIVEESSQALSKDQALSKKMRLNLDINPNTPDSGYGSATSSPSQEEKGMKDSYESEKINIRHDQSPRTKYITSEIELDDIALDMEEKENTPPIRKIFDQGKGTKGSYESEKQKNVDNRSLGKSEIYNKAKLIVVKEYEPELNKIQVTRKNLIPAQNTQNHTAPKAEEKFSKLDTDYRNKQNLRTGNKSPLPPILSSGDNKQGRSR